METNIVRKKLWVDLGFASMLLGWAGLWLVLFRKAQWIHTWLGFGFFAAVFALLVGVWTRMARRQDFDTNFVATKREPGTTWSLWRELLPVLLLFLVTWVAFYQPLKIHFWGGGDDFYSLQKFPIWNSAVDVISGRPLNSAVCQIALWLTPDRVEGSLWLAFACDFFIALLLYAIIRKIAPSAALCGWCAAMLFLVNRGDNTRFLVMWTTNFYWPPLFLLLAALWFFLVSQERRSRPLLVLSCLLLGCCFLINEGTFPLALFGPLLLWLRCRDLRASALWIFAWVGTMGLLALRLLLHLTEGAETYQSTQLAASAHDPAALASTLKMHLLAFFRYFPVPEGWAALWLWGAAAFLVSALALAWACKSSDAGAVRRRQLGFGLALGSIAYLLGVLPFLHLAGLERTHFLAAPGEAVFLAFALGIITSLVGRRVGIFLMVICVAGLVALNTVAAFASQTHAKETNAVTFDKMVHIFQQVHSVAPVVRADAAVLLYVDDFPGNPLGLCYSTHFLMREILEVQGAQLSANYLFDNCKVALMQDGARLPPKGVHKTFDQIVVFRCSLDGTVSLLSKFPDKLLPAGVTAAGYNPMALPKPALITPLPFFRYVRWSVQPLDIVDTEKGIGLGEGWSDLQVHRGHLYRRARQDAQFVINPAGRTTCELHLLVDPPVGDWKFEILNEASAVLASAELSKGNNLRPNIALDPTHLNVIRMHLTPLAPTPAPANADFTFRILRPDKKTVVTNH